MNADFQVIFELKDISVVARELIRFSKGNNILTFSGELGAGKTTLISAICKELGVREVVSSPTFAIVQQYTTNNGANIYHMDLYRIKSGEDAINSGLEDCLLSGDRCLVEWPENAPGIFPPETVHVNIEIMSREKRKLTAHLPG